MFNTDMLYSNCHGSLLRADNDFSKNASPSNPVVFILADDFHTNPKTPALGVCRTFRL